MIQFIKLSSPADYMQTLSIMEDRVQQIINKKAQEIIYLAEHDDVYTAGTNYKIEELLQGGNIPVIFTGRGGKFTYHGKGQRVIYPIIDLARHNRQKDLRLYVRNLEKWIINSLAHCGVRSYSVPGKVGIWVKDGNNEAKIAAIGIRVRKWIAYHGIAVNISTNLDKYNGIIPCGLSDFAVTSLLKLNINISLDEFDNIIEQEFCRVF